MSTHRNLSLRDIALLVPRSIGFIPTESVVLWLLNNGTLVLAMRVDIDTAQDPAALAGGLPRHVEYNQTVAFAVSADSDGITWARRATEPLPNLLDFVLIAGGYVAGAAAISVVEPTAYTLTEEDVAEVALELTYRTDAGATVALTREEIAEQYEPSTDSRPMRELGDQPAAKAATALLAGDGDPDLLADIAVRDLVLCSVARGAKLPLSRSVDWVQATPAAHAAPALTVAACLAYIAGDGARATIALGKALEVDPDYSLASLIRTSVSMAVPPATMAEIFASADLATP